MWRLFVTILPFKVPQTSTLKPESIYSIIMERPGLIAKVKSDKLRAVLEESVILRKTRRGVQHTASQDRVGHCMDWAKTEVCLF
jgi:hypothetical protein